MYIYCIGTSNKISVKKTAVHNIHKLAWGPYARGPPCNCPACPCGKTALITQGYFFKGVLCSNFCSI